MKIKIPTRKVIVEHAIKTENGAEIVTTEISLPKKTKNVEKFVNSEFKGVIDFELVESSKTYDLNFELALESGLLVETTD